MKSYSSREIIRLLEQDGWFLTNCVGSHLQFKHPFKKGRVIDVSRAAAKKLGMINSGIAKVNIKVVD